MPSHFFTLIHQAMKPLATKYRGIKNSSNGRDIWEQRLEIGFIIERLDKQLFAGTQWSESIAESMGCISLADTFLGNGRTHYNFVLCEDFTKENVTKALHTFWNEAAKLKFGIYTFHISAVYNNIHLVNRSIDGKPSGWSHYTDNKMNKVIALYPKLKDVPEELIPSEQLQLS